jgi:hypothetical protein
LNIRIYERYIFALSNTEAHIIGETKASISSERNYMTRSSLLCCSDTVILTVIIYDYPFDIIRRASLSPEGPKLIATIECNSDETPGRQSSDPFGTFGLSGQVQNENPN